MIAGTFGNPACWVGDLSFVECCAVRIFGPEGNEDCWRRLAGGTFRRCCLDVDADEQERWGRARETLQAAQGNFHTAVERLAVMIHGLDLERTMLAKRPLWPWEEEQLAGLSDLVRQWRGWQITELAAKLGDVLVGFE
eukprot:CAMPEP_0195146994 /NCGR_PEP_ID=MMETSP0448-20130528/172600_1 /TAXON_ID=66468 /ORGANISM="Heterocapsa triquestra, Strain CCMP 448" /LENGTH=137 /DNA_ID=CAMNT_0040185561 /DNA_START=14 /DNA_END=424 /DNA_ORIENTATION=+